MRKRPGDASRRQYKVWGEYYDSIFNPNVYPETYLLVYRIVEICNARRRELLRELQDTDIKRIIVSNGIYHLARAVAFLWRNGDDWNDIDQIRRDLQKIDDEPELLESYFDEALKILINIFEGNELFMQDPSIAMKSVRLDDEINKALYLEFARSG